MSDINAIQILGTKYDIVPNSRVKNLGSISSLSGLVTAIKGELATMSIGDVRPVYMNNAGHDFGLFTWTGTWAGWIQRVNANAEYAHVEFTCIIDNAGRMDIHGFVGPNSYYWYIPAMKSDLSSYVPTSDIYHGLDTTQTQLVLGADQGKALNDKFANYFKRGGANAPSDMNDTSLIGTYFAQASSCPNLPTSSSGEYYYIICFGIYQIAAKYLSSGITAVYTRGYINSQWYPWKSTNYSGGWLATGTNLDNVLMPGTYGIDGSSTYTNLPSGVSSSILEVFGPHTSDNNWIMQRITTNNGKIFERWRTGSSGTSFSSWRKFVEDDNLRANIAYIEDGTTYSHAHEVGCHVLRNGNIYRVKTAVSSGTTIDEYNHLIKIDMGVIDEATQPINLGKINTLSDLENKIANVFATLRPNEMRAMYFNNDNSFSPFTFTGTWTGFAQRHGGAAIMYADLRCITSTGAFQQNIGFLGSTTRVWKKINYT